MTTKEDIEKWFENGIKENATHMIIVCDTYSYEDYPVYVTKDEKVENKINEYKEKYMQKIMEVYDLSTGIDVQINKRRNFNY